MFQQIFQDFKNKISILSFVPVKSEQNFNTNKFVLDDGVEQNNI